MTPFGSTLQSVFERPPPSSSVMISSFPSDVTSDWCEIEMSLTSSAPSASSLGMIAIVFALPDSTWLTSTIQMDLIAATYAVLPSRDKWMSCGRQSPRALEPSALRITTRLNDAPAGQRSAVAVDSPMKR